MYKNNSPYSDLYKGYFDTRDPYTSNLDEIYQKPVPIPIYTADELFSNQILDNIDQHIFKYFHFIAARACQIEPLKHMYLAYCSVKRDWDRQMQLYLEASELLNSGSDQLIEDYNSNQSPSVLRTLRKEIDYLFENNHYQIESFVKESLCLSDFYTIVQRTHLKFKKALLDFQSDLEEERKMAILNAY